MIVGRGSMRSSFGLPSILRPRSSLGKSRRMSMASLTCSGASHEGSFLFLVGKYSFLIDSGGRSGVNDQR